MQEVQVMTVAMFMGPIGGFVSQVKGLPLISSIPWPNIVFPGVQPGTKFKLIGYRR